MWSKSPRHRNIWPNTPHRRLWVKCGDAGVTKGKLWLTHVLTSKSPFCNDSVSVVKSCVASAPTLCGSN